MQTFKATLFITLAASLICLCPSASDGSALNGRAHKLTVQALQSTARGDYDAAIRQYRAALQVRPDDRGIQLALGYVMYLRDKQEVEWGTCCLR